MNSKHLPFRLSVRALVTNGSGEYLVLKRSGKSRYWPHEWDLPGGAVDPGESFEEALIREVREETGLEVSLTGVAGAFEIDHHLHRVAVLVMTATGETDEVHLSPEHVEHRWVTWSTLADIGLFAPLRDFYRQIPAPD